MKKAVPEKKKPKKAEKKKVRKKAPTKKSSAEKKQTGKDAKRSTNKGNADKQQKVGTATGKKNAKGSKQGKSKRSDRAGNAKVSNYPGKVARKIRSAARRLKSKGKSGKVVVGFTVSTSGGASGIRIARSSGHPEVDQLALKSRRARSAIPENSHRSRPQQVALHGTHND